jgi:hypothetical protein
MKIIAYLSLAIITTSCTLHGQQDVQEAALLKKIGKKPLDRREIDRGKANSMYENHKKGRVRKVPQLLAEFDREELIRILSQESDQPTVKFFLASYTENEGAMRREDPTILLQVAHTAAPTSKASAVALTYKYFEPNKLCPPPSPCGDELETN